MTDSAYTIQQSTVEGLGSALDGKDSVDLSNSPYTTNRILEIPQDIKLELNNGTLTLKAGSKVCVPNGSSFDFITINSDLSVTPSNNGKNFIIVHNINTTPAILNVLTNYCYSGSSAPTSGYAYVWYDTTNKVVKYNSSSSTTSHNWQTVGCSFPICLGTTASGSGMTSVDQVFNGFGYIGSTVFALPMKGQATTAINDDGTLTSIIWETTTVQTLAVSASGSVSMSSAGVLTEGFNEIGYTKLADVTYYDSRIQSVNFFDIGLVANTNASNLSKAGRSYLAGMGMPDVSKSYLVSNNFASATKFNAPSNGYFSFRAGWSTSGILLLYMHLVSDTNVNQHLDVGGYFYNTSGSTNQSITLSVFKGQKVDVQYNNANLTQSANYGLWFIPAIGEN